MRVTTTALAFANKKAADVPNKRSTANNNNKLEQLSFSLDDEYVAFAHELADAARHAGLPYWRVLSHNNDNASSLLQVETKVERGRSVSQTESPVTAADRAAEQVMRKLIEERYPQHGCIGEEFGAVRTDAEWVWVLDPIDGTKAFMTGKPLFGTLIACLHEGVPVLGIMDQCVLDERWVGQYGKPTTLNGDPVQTGQQQQTLSNAMLYATTPDMFRQGEEADKFKALSRAVRHPNYGADCYAYALVASGFGAHLVVEADLGIYDYCALVPILEGAGGVMTDWEGRNLTLWNHEASQGRVVAASNRALHRQALQFLSGTGSALSSKSAAATVLLNVQTFLPAFAIGVALGLLLARGFH